MKRVIYQVLALLVLFALGVMPLLLCAGCDCPTECEVDAARVQMTEILESQMRAPVPEPDPLFKDPPEPKPEPKPEPPAAVTDSGDETRSVSDDLKPVPMPAGWPEGMWLQKWSGPNCAPCREWDRLYGEQLAAVMLPEQWALDAQNRTTPAASQAGISGALPQFQLIKNGRVVWIGRGSFTADMIIERAKQKANE